MYDECTYEEVKAMRDLQDDPFTEMTGLKREDLIWQYGHEEAYLEIAEQDLEQQLECFPCPKKTNQIKYEDVTKKTKTYFYKKRKKKELINLCINEEDDNDFVCVKNIYYRRKNEKGEFYFIRFYRNSNRSSYYKKQSNKKIRHTKHFKYNKGHNCYKEYNFWNEMD